MGGAAEKWRPGRGRRPGWGAQAGGVHWGAGGGRGPGGSGGPGGSWRAAAAAAPSAPPDASGLGLGLRGPDASRSSLRLCCNNSWRCCSRRCCSCCHNPRPWPGRRQLRTRPWPLLHLRGGVVRPRRAGRHRGQRGRSSQARVGRWSPARRQPPAARAADSALTLMLRGAPEPGGALLPASSPSHRGSWPGRPPPRRPGFVWWPRHQWCPWHVTNPGRGWSARCPQLGEQASQEAGRCCPGPDLLRRAGLVLHPRGTPEETGGFLAPGLCERLYSYRPFPFFTSGVPLSNLIPVH